MTWRQVRVKTILSFLLLLGLCGGVSAATDVRVLIDVSGSMKQNDPNNLRRPALRLLVGLLPSDARAGVWTFAGSVRALIPPGRVDGRWKKRARKAASRIGSPGQRTDIALALRRATRGWKRPVAEGERHLVLLTDGMVDVSTDERRNEASRIQVLDEILPRLTELGVQIHTIALSEHADHELLETLSRESGGWYEQVDQVERLQRVFLRMFEKVGKPDTVPLSDNRFVIDRSIEEATLLLFTEGDAQTRLVMPGGKSFDRAHKPDNVSWHVDQGYELITITKPRAGKWRVKALVDPDNRVMVVTNLKMHTTDLANTLVAGEQLPFTAEFLNNGQRITRKAFLELIEADVAGAPLGVAAKPVPLMDDGGGLDEKPGDGLFSVVLTAMDDPGLFEVTAHARASTFRRERRQTVNVVPPASVEVDQKNSPAVLDIALQEGLIDPSSVDVEAWLEIDGGKRAVRPRKETDGHYRAQLKTDDFSGSGTLVIELQTTSKRGNAVSWRYRYPRVKGHAQTKPVPPAAPRVPAIEPAPPTADWGEILLYLGMGNGALVVLGGGGWWFLRRRRARNLVRFPDATAEAA